ncbi:hypothetical protein GHT06_016025 [Daphnia sinensis]|uniref:Methyltransferase FkbM domain-containing protein n=1 Tax=Daphnia sinensis TaxID=1820382 RepID=A0AAD5KS05_9CRUS|nr:hypothetical protein GHT06_016025 [Daphnia sinensis]
MRFVREFRLPTRVSLFVFPIGLMSLIYILSQTTRMDPNPLSNNHIKTDRHYEPEQVSALTTPQWPVETLPVKFNLMEETYGKNWAEAPADLYLPPIECTIEYANANKLQQDHPCVIRLIRRHYLFKPAPRSVQYRLAHPEAMDPSDGQSRAILEILQNKTNGFFIEVGGYDGEFLSNTLFMERYLHWSGLLIEADKTAFSQLRTRNRKAYTSPVCLSTKPYPMQVVYNATVGTLSSILEKDAGQDKAAANGDTNSIYKVQCFPLYSLLVAIDRTNIDYFGLDVEGSEYKILKTMPWSKVYVKTMTVEWNHTPEGEAAITRLMESNKFIKFGHISLPSTREVVYVRDFLDQYRQTKHE